MTNQDADNCLTIKRELQGLISPDEPKSNCTVELLLMAAQSAYRIGKDNVIDPAHSEAYAKTLADIKEHGYRCASGITPLGSKGTGTTPLAAITLYPTDQTDKIAPIIIAFRGTATLGDVGSDLKIGVTGTVGKAFRDEAFQYYNNILMLSCGRPIVLTGHSLGGHLATYVGTRAYDLKLTSPVQVRTFNTAPVSTAHDGVFEKSSNLRNQFVNYRINTDVPSALTLHESTGDTFDFPSSKGAAESHFLGALMSELPEAILKGKIGATASVTQDENLLIERTQGMLHSYQCRVANQYFSSIRQGQQNLEEMSPVLNKLVQRFESKQYDLALTELQTLKTKLDGRISIDMVDVLIKSVNSIKTAAEVVDKSAPHP